MVWSPGLLKDIVHPIETRLTITLPSGENIYRTEIMQCVCMVHVIACMYILSVLLNYKACCMCTLH